MTHNRNIENVCHVEAHRVYGEGLKLKIYADSPTGKPITITATIEWWIVPQIVREMYKVWRAERQTRLSEIQNLDEALQGGKQ
ncbi:hypothetical protein [Rubellicoccus peritrichatus]|uniref:Uncharacterized protein n=1 Tax=Rubellicoccus peritrichatus TaxID=3080537 RepID=A0AAQ3LAA6_9BACT|nr:hypothetical protein [Puniceicoccus sp. CR14]WOO40404.1 hypothetical protein RZN69_17430 [Puniceicoccus sp. CR14]WOO40453.1 hypothetical protein RZN69_17675 [Puniceicoccus sp. CR14]WOO40502.1 hypothetical protein RZN69_17920 [Puniceicoccus sp. CR14]WOO40552.1 hypothetical protein RZN69_18170 [Puniceicoccus sp. CR14]